MAMSLGGARQRAEINITPLIDVLLVLLIIFMVIAPVMPNGLTAKVPQPSNAAVATSTAVDVVLTVQADRTVRLNQELVTLENLGSRLKTLFGDSPNQPVFVRAEKGLEFEQVAQVIDIAKGAGLDTIALATR